MVFINLPDGSVAAIPREVVAPHPREFERLLSLCGLGAIDPGEDPLLDEVARSAAALCGASIGLVTLVRAGDQTFVGREGIDLCGTSRDESFCAHTILQDTPMVVEDARQDRRFAHLALVTESPFVRFYAGAPILDGGGLPVGSVCVLDVAPRELSSAALLSLQRLAAMAGIVLEARRALVASTADGLSPAGLRLALRRLDGALEPLLGRANGFRPVLA